MLKAATLVLWASTVFAQPLIFHRGIVNAGSSAPAGLPGGAIARGSLLTIYGSGLGPTPGVSAGTYPIPTTLGGASVDVLQGSTKVASALPVFASAGQLNVLMPSTTPLGMLSLRVSFNNRSSNLAPVQVVASSVGLLSVSGTGSGPGVVQNDLTDGTVPVNTTRLSTAPGQIITIYGTGLGAVSADNVAPTAGNLPVAVEAWIGGQSAKVNYSGRSPCCSGLDQFVLTVPDNAPLGCWVPVFVRTAGTTLSNAVTIAISSTPQTPCSESSNLLAAGFLGGKKIGTVRMFRSSTRMDVGVVSPVEAQSDLLQVDAAQAAGGDFAFAPLFSQPPPGACNVFLSSGDAFGGGRLPSASGVVKRLATGSTYTITGPKGPINALIGNHSVQLGVYAPLAPAFNNQLVLDPGSYTIAAAGGADGGSVSATVSFPAAFTWTGRDSLSTIDRTQPLPLSWSGVPSGQSMAILGFGIDKPTNSSATFYCRAPAGAANFTVPAAILGALPATRKNDAQSKGAIYLMTAAPNNGSALTMSGTDAATIIAGHMIGKTVRFK
jgi:uncharacterized protein (TIGR03437 family)